MDLPLVLDIAWEGSVLPTPYVPGTVDVLITLNMNNVAETSFWRGQMPPTCTGIQGAWIMAVETIPSTEAGDFVHLGAWASCGFRKLSVYMEAEGDSWIACDTVPIKIASLLAPPGLGNGNTIVPSAENVFVVVSKNNFPIRPPMLQARWWCPGYNSLSVPNSWILGVADNPSSSTPFVRTVSCCVRQGSEGWTMDGNMQTCIVTDQLSHLDIPWEFELILPSAPVDVDASSTPMPPTSAPSFLSDGALKLHLISRALL